MYSSSFDLILLFLPFFYTLLPRQSPFCALISSSFLFHTISPDPFLCTWHSIFFSFSVEWPAQARELGVDTFSFLTWAILELRFGYGKWVQMAFPLIDQL